MVMIEEETICLSKIQAKILGQDITEISNSRCKIFILHQIKRLIPVENLLNKEVEFLLEELPNLVHNSKHLLTHSNKAKTIVSSLTKVEKRTY